MSGRSTPFRPGLDPLCRALACLALVGVAALYGGCGASGDGDDTPPAQTRSAQRFADCEQLRAYLIETAATQGELARRYSAWSESPFTDGAPTASPGSDDLAAPAQTRDHTGTNNQEAGVDELDFVKTDGDHLYVLGGGFLTVFAAWPPEQTRELVRLPVAGQPLGVFVHAGTVAVISQEWGAASLAGAPLRTAGAVRVELLDCTDPGAPATLRELLFEGSYSAARMVAGRVHLVLHSFLDTYQPSGPAPGDAVREATPAFREAPLDELIPRYADRRREGAQIVETSAAICACEDFYRPATPNGTGLVSLVTLDLERPPAPVRSTSLASNSGLVYASAGHLYLAARNDDSWLWLPALEGGAEEPRPTTQIHQFSLGTEATYQAGGEVPGWLLNTFSMGEHDGALRVATTLQDPRLDAAPANGLYTLRRAGERLETLAVLTGLGKPGERIQAVRLAGPVGYVVTYERVDPLYVLDLSDPQAPRVAGELEVPGFSTYLHPLAGGRLLAVGEHVDPRGIDLSLFDVSDPAEPALVARQFLGAGSYSEAQYEHKAFTFHPASGLLALPAVLWSGDPTGQTGFAPDDLFAGLLVYAVDPDRGFELQGQVEHADFYWEPERSQWYYPEPVRRSLFIAGPGSAPFLYSVSGRGLKVHRVTDLDQALVALPLPQEPHWWLEAPAVSP